MRRKVLSGAVVVAAVVLCFCLDGFWSSSTARSQDVYDSLRIFSDVLTLVETNYVDDVKPRDLIQNAIQGLVSRLDPHSAYMPPDIYKEMQVETKGSFGGLGLEITLKDNVLTVVAPIEDSPAFLAGVKTGDTIIRVDAESTKNMTLLAAVKKMRGKPGTKVTIFIMRPGFKKPKAFTLIRAIIKIKSVKVKKLDATHACIRIVQFQQTASSEFEKGLTTLRSDMPNLDGIVLDLRGNPGGLLDQAVKISDAFIDSGLIVYTEGRTESQKMEFMAKSDVPSITCPVVVLVNSGSASAAEIVAGALQDHNRAIIVGTQTFGKGTVQTIFPLSDGSGLRITTAKYYTPGHRSIQEKGITPDIRVEDTLEKFALTGKSHKAFREKDLVDHFKNGATAPEAPDEKEGTRQSKQQTDARSKGSTQIDKPMETALNVLKNWGAFRKKLGKKSL